MKIRLRASRQVLKNTLAYAKPAFLMSSSEAPNRIFDRKNERYFLEKVLGAQWIASVYPPKGRHGSLAFWGRIRLIQKLISWLVGLYQSSRYSQRKIAPFVHDYQIDLADFQTPPSGFSSFNDFFIRKIRTEARPYPKDSRELGSPCEARLSVFPIESLAKSQLFVKNQKSSVVGLFGPEVSEELFAQLQSFVGGHAWTFRLCPVDYHRFHFPDSGIASPATIVSGKLDSVNPLALSSDADIFIKNERQWSFLKSEHFGLIALIEVGAMCVGKIKQNYTPGSQVQRGQEKGYFEFGGSTQIMLSQGSMLVPDPDLLAKSAQGEEVLISLGEKIASAPNKA